MFVLFNQPNCEVGSPRLLRIILIYPSLEYKFVKIKEITTKDVTDGKKYEALKKFLNLTNLLFSKFANINAIETVKGTVPKVNKTVFLKAIQNILSLNIAL